MRRLFHFISGLFSIGLFMGLTVLRLSAQEGPRIDPRHVSYDSLRFFGQMTLTGCKPGLGNFTGDIHPLGKLSTDGPICWALDRVHCDTTYQEYGYNIQARDIWIYRGINGGLPSIESGERIGLSEPDAVTTFLCAGDFDNSGYKDLLCRIHKIADSSYGNTAGYGTSHLAIFWADDTGGYSINDTTMISNGTDAWLGPRFARSYDCNHDAIDDLVLYQPGAGFVDGKPAKGILPDMMIFLGRDTRWENKTASLLPDWTWWRIAHTAVLPLDDLSFVDQDCDGYQDMIFYYNRTASISVLYGNPASPFPDTTNIESATFTAAHGEYSLLSDVTGDRVPELVVSAPSIDLIRVYAGKPGQRIIEQYGNGIDSLDRLNARYPLRPWAELWLPHKLHEGWFQSGPTLSDLGDISGDSADEIWAGSSPFLLGYVSRVRLDSMIDVLYRFEGFADVIRLGDIDASKVPTIAVAYHNGIIMYMKPGRVPLTGRYRQLPHDLNAMCGLISNVAPTSNEAHRTLQLHAQPNPAEDVVHISWLPRPNINTGSLIVHDILGREVYRSLINPKEGSTSWNAKEVVGGIYLIMVTIGSNSETISIVIR